MIFSAPCAKIIFNTLLKEGGIFTEALAYLRDGSKIIKALVNAQKTPYYPILFAFLCTIGGSNGYTVYIPIMYILLSFVIFSALFTDDNKVFLTPLCMIYFSLGKDKVAHFVNSGGDLLAYMNDKALKHVVIIAILGIGALVIRLIADGSVLRALKKRRYFTWGIIAMDIALLLSGIFSPRYSLSATGYGALIAVGFTAVYFLVSGMLDGVGDPIPYACTVVLCNSYSVLAQITVSVLRLISEDRWIIYILDIPQINTAGVTLGWGVPTVMGAVLVLGIPAAMYLAKNSRSAVFCSFACFSSFLFVIGTLMINSRSSMLAGIVAIAICILICAVKGKQKKPFVICAAVCIAVGVGVVSYILRNIMSLEEMLQLLRIDKFRDSGRVELWRNGIEDLKLSPIFGVGFADGAFPEGSGYRNFYSNMYHCILIQIPAAMGAVGCVAFLFHIYEGISMLLKRASTDKLLLLLPPMMILGMSLLDNFFFYPEFQIFYCVFLVLAEKLHAARQPNGIS